MNKSNLLKRTIKIGTIKSFNFVRSIKNYYLLLR